MKKTNRDKYIAILSALVALGLFLLGYKNIAMFICIPAVLMIGFSPSKSGNLFFVASLLALGVSGFIIDSPIEKYPPALVSLLAIACIMQVRNTFFDQLHLHKWLAFEATGINLVVILFFCTAPFAGYSWQQWTSGSILVGMFSLFSVVIYKDRAQARDLVEKTKLATGVLAPDFTLEDQNGKMVSLSEILRTQHALLIFVRGDWCPTCHMMLRGYVKNKDILAQKNIRIVGVGPDPIGVNKEIMSRIDENSLMLSDNDQQMAGVYSHALQRNNPITAKIYKNGIPLPASFLVHQNGKIIYTSRSDKAAEILQPEKIFEALATL